MNSKVEQERNEIAAAIGDMTLVDVMNRNAERFGSRAALKWTEPDGVRTMSWSAYRDRVREAAAGLLSLGMGKGDFAAIMASNRPEHVMADLGAIFAGAVPVSMYNTLAPSQVSYIAGHCGAKVAILENAEYYEKWSQVRSEIPELRHVVVMDPSDDFTPGEGDLTWEGLLDRGRGALAADPGIVERAAAEAGPGDLATLIYTSGTTGDPKGVMISHRNVLWTSECIARAFPELPDHLRIVSYLPLAHLGERMASHYTGVWRAGSVWYEPDLANVLAAVQAHRPQGFFAVPRVWEKFQAGLSAKLQAEPKKAKRQLATGAVELGSNVERARQAGESPSAADRVKLWFAERLVFRKIRHGLGLDELILAFSAAAPIAPELLIFFRGIGIPVYELFGQTESSGPGVTNRPGADRIGSVGRAMPGVEVAIAEDDEILMRGGLVTEGYYRDPEATAAAFGEDGWLRTGDLGRLDEEGFLSIIGRKKEIIITAAGKNVAPARLENLLAQNPLIAHSCVVGDGRRYLTLLVALDEEAAPAWAARNGVDFQDMAGFSKEPALLAEIGRAVEEANQQAARVEQAKRWAVVPDVWSAETDELTPSLKLKRRVVLEKYATQIEEMYAADEEG